MRRGRIIIEKLLIKNGRVIDPANNIDEQLDILIDDGKIAGVGKNIDGNDAKIIDATNLIVSPGFIDLHVHFREPGFEYKETVESGSHSAVAGGFTAVCCMANLNPVNDNATVTRTINEKSKQAGYARVYPIGAVSKGMMGRELAEIGEMKEAGIVAISDDGKCLLNPQMVRNAMEYGSMFNLTVVEHCQDETANEGVINEGAISARYGIKGMPPMAEDSIAVRDIVMSQYTNLPMHIAHISTKGAVDAVRNAKAKGLKVTAEVTPHHFTLTDDELDGFDANFKMSPPLRTKEDIKAIKEGLKDGTIDCIATDHAPHAEWEKEVELDKAPFGIVGLETALPLSLALVEEGVITLNEMVALLTNRPAKVFNLQGGNLSLGSSADVAIFDPQNEWVVDPSEFKSKGRNTPFKGWKVKGKNLLTIVAGKMVYNSANL